MKNSVDPTQKLFSASYELEFTTHYEIVLRILQPSNM